MKPVLIFDLDGTLVDSKKDLTASVNHVRHSFDLPTLTEDEIARFIGDGALMVIRRALGDQATEQNVQTALQTFLSYYRVHMLDSTDLYPGVRETLDLLSDCSLAVLTNKPVNFSRAMLDGLGILHLFEAVYGGNSFERKKPDPIGIRQILSDTRGAPDRTWMIGDSVVDVLTGRNAGVHTCGVTYGYAAASFEQHAPDLLIDTFSDVRRLVGNGRP
jgi:phosphoglycolate phosphatase